MTYESVLPETGCLSCGGRAEPEEEDGLTKYACTVCGYEFGFTQVRVEDDCQLGIPEPLRLAGRSIDIPFDPDTLTEEGRRVFLGATIFSRRPE